MTLADYGYVGGSPATFTDPSGLVRIIPKVRETPTAGDKGKTFVDGVLVLWDCPGERCTGYKPKFTVLINMRVLYTQWCPAWSKRHERLHVDQFVANVTHWANAFLGPLEAKSFGTWGECQAAATDAVELFKRQPREIYDMGQDKIDRYFPCLIQF
jgi:hypothetical protein